ncbi:MAG: transketolase family protein [Candidatus Omnitrophica bacterium]|nr:transketolase family protein [Candidatus Omnitrophota bacterium]
MTEQEKLYARDVYGQTLVELGKEDPNIVVLDADLSGSTRTALFAREFPDRFFNFGVAEQNMMAAAAGLASCGKIVFASTFAMFATARPLDQIRNSICYNRLNVKIVATHGGITVGEDGASHQALEDVAFLRSIPHIRIIVPADAHEARDTIRTVYKTPGPFYIRLGRSKIPTLSQRKEFVVGKGYMLSEGGDLAVIACGIMVNEAVLARGILKEKGIDIAVANIHTIKPLDEELVLALAKRYKKLIVCEEHQSRGGLYSSVCEFLSGVYPVKVASVAVNDRFGQSGSPQELMEKYELSAKAIAHKAEELLRD